MSRRELGVSVFHCLEGEILLGAGPRAQAPLGCTVWVGYEPANSIADGRARIHWNEPPTRTVSADHLGKSTARARDHRSCAGHRFENRESEGLHVAHMNETDRGIVRADELRLWEATREAHAHAEGSGSLAETTLLRALAADDEQRHVVAESGQRVEEEVVPLLPRKSADGKYEWFAPEIVRSAE